MATNDGTGAQMEKMIIQLENKVRQRKMKTTGIKAELIKRLQAVMIVGKDEDLSDDDKFENLKTRRANFTMT